MARGLALLRHFRIRSRFGMDSAAEKAAKLAATFEQHNNAATSIDDEINAAIAQFRSSMGAASSSPAQRQPPPPPFDPWHDRSFVDAEDD